MSFSIKDEDQNRLLPSNHCNNLPVADRVMFPKLRASMGVEKLLALQMTFPSFRASK